MTAEEEKKVRLLETADKFDDMALALAKGFQWNTSREGSAYWFAQHAHLKSLADRLRERAVRS